MTTTPTIWVALAVALLAASGCSPERAAEGRIELDTRAERTERDVDVWVATQAELAASAQVIRRACEQLQCDADEARGRVSVSRVGDSAVLAVRVTPTNDLNEARELCNTTMNAYLTLVLERAMQEHLRRGEPLPEAGVESGARVLEPCQVPPR
jgi:hypothetical protein